MSMRAFIGFSALFLSAITFSTPLAAAETRRDVATTQNSDYFGFDLRTVQDVTLDQCKADCVEDLSCRAFTYNPKVRWCFLKSDFNQMNSFPGAIAGRIVQTDGEDDIGAPPSLDFITDSMREQAREMRSGLSIASDFAGQGVESLASLGRIETASGRIQQALDASNQNRTRAAELLGMSVRTLRNKLNAPDDDAEE